MDNSDHTILIIDDDDGLRLGLAATLRHRGFTVLAAEDGGDGLEKARACKPDLILCDVMMPPPNGFDLKRMLAADPALGGIPFIFLTARSGMEDRLNGLDHGADDYITKPFEPRELLAKVEALLRRVEMEQVRGREQMRKQAESELEAFKQQIMQNFQHELRTPLTNILMPLENILSHRFDSPEEQLRFIRSALQNAHRLDALTTDFIMMASIDHGEINTLRMHIDIENGLLPAARRRLERYQEKNLRFNPSLHLKSALMAPRKEFTHALLHVLDNAFKFSPAGGQVGLEIAVAADGAALLRVSDEGPGIPAELREKVFERFYQSSQGDTRDYEGLGVGLTLAKALFEALGGGVRILDGAPRGCLVEMTLPAETREEK